MDEAAVAGGVGALRHAVFALGNLGVMDANKHLLLRAGAVDELVRLSVHPDEELHKASGGGGGGGRVLLLLLWWWWWRW